MADSSFPITPGTGASGSVDVRTESTNANLRQVVVLGDPLLNNNVAAVLSQDVGGSDQTTPAIAMRMAGSASVQIVGSTGTIGVHIQSTAGTLAVRFADSPIVTAYGMDGTTGRPLRMNSDGAIKIYDIAGGSIGITSMPTTSGIYLAATAGTLRTKLDPESILSGIQSSISVRIQETAGTLRVKLDPESILSGIQSTIGIRIVETAGTLRTKLDPESVISGIQSSINVRILQTAGTLIVKADPSSAGLATDDAAFGVAVATGSPIMSLFDDTATDSVDEGDVGVLRMTGNRILMSHSDSTASIFTASGTASGVSVSGNTIISPSSAYSFKIYAYSIQTTGAVSLAATFTNGAGSATEFWRPLVTASGVTGVQGANLSSAGPGSPLFATGANTTLALKLDTATLVHYSVAYTKESA